MFIISRWYYVKIYFYAFLTCLKHVAYKYSLTICDSIISFDPMCAFTTPSRPRHRKQKACFIKVISIEWSCMYFIQYFFIIIRLRTFFLYFRFWLVIFCCLITFWIQYIDKWHLHCYHTKLSVDQYSTNKFICFLNKYIII